MVVSPSWSKGLIMEALLVPFYFYPEFRLSRDIPFTTSTNSDVIGLLKNKVKIGELYQKIVNCSDRLQPKHNRSRQNDDLGLE